MNRRSQVEPTSFSKITLTGALLTLGLVNCGKKNQPTQSSIVPEKPISHQALPAEAQVVHPPQPVTTSTTIQSPSPSSINSPLSVNSEDKKLRQEETKPLTCNRIEFRASKDALKNENFADQVNQFFVNSKSGDQICVNYGEDELSTLSIEKKSEGIVLQAPAGLESDGKIVVEVCTNSCAARLNCASIQSLSKVNVQEQLPRDSGVQLSARVTKALAELDAKAINQWNVIKSEPYACPSLKTAATSKSKRVAQ